jgi:hypothetical protein
MNETNIRELIDKFNGPQVTISTVYGDGGTDSPWPRFERAVTNQACDGDATLSRYAIWANTVRDNLVQALAEIKNNDAEKAEVLIIRSINSLSAFSEVQGIFGPLR